MPYVDLDGCRIWCELKGSGGHLLQIPGMFFAHDNFGLGSRELALNIAAQACSRSFLDGDSGAETVESIRQLVERNCTLEIFCAVCDAMIEVDLGADLERIRAPTLVTVGSEDVMTPLDQGPKGIGNRALAELITNARLYVMEGVGHANLLEAPELTTEVVVEFLQGVEAV